METLCTYSLNFVIFPFRTISLLFFCLDDTNRQHFNEGRLPSPPSYQSNMSGYMQADQQNYPHQTDNGYQQDDHYGQPMQNCMQQPPSLYNRPPPPFNQPPPNIHLQPPRKYISKKKKFYFCILT